LGLHISTFPLSFEIASASSNTDILSFLLFSVEKNVKAEFNKGMNLTFKIFYQMWKKIEREKKIL